METGDASEGGFEASGCDSMGKDTENVGISQEIHHWDFNSFPLKVSMFQLFSKEEFGELVTNNELCNK